MHRDRIREAEIAEEELPQLWGEMACVADPDVIGDQEEEQHRHEDELDEDGDDDEPDTVPELEPEIKITVPLSKQDVLDQERAEGEGMGPHPSPARLPHVAPPQPPPSKSANGV